MTALSLNNSNKHSHKGKFPARNLHRILSYWIRTQAEVRAKGFVIPDK